VSVREEYREEHREVSEHTKMVAELIFVWLRTTTLKVLAQVLQAAFPHF
jgi:hypothetical protein